MATPAFFPMPKIPLLYLSYYITITNYKNTLIYLILPLSQGESVCIGVSVYGHYSIF